MTEDEKIWEVIEVVLNGNPAPDDIKYLEIWLQQDRDNRKTFEALKNTGLKNKIDSKEIKKNAFLKIQAEIASTRTTRRLTPFHYGAAASIVVLLGLGVLFLHLRSNSGQVAYIETKSPLGMETSIVLSDSTAVHLAPGSVLRYPASFTTEKREVTLNGEAYFEVTKDKKHPFIVHTSHIDIRVLGTKFNLKAYNDGADFITTLVEGSVGISEANSQNPADMVKLKPNQQAIYDHSTGKIALREVDAKLYSKWKEGKYFFENETFVAIAKDIERNYNVVIKINYEELKHDRFSGLIDKRKTVYQLLDELGQYGSFGFTLSNDTIIIQKNKP